MFLEETANADIRNRVGSCKRISGLDLRFVGEGGVGHDVDLFPPLQLSNVTCVLKLNADPIMTCLNRVQRRKTGVRDEECERTGGCRFDSKARARARVNAQRREESGTSPLPNNKAQGMLQRATKVRYQRNDCMRECVCEREGKELFGEL
jgi:hypothetical protein